MTLTTNQYYRFLQEQRDTKAQAKAEWTRLSEIADRKVKAEIARERANEKFLDDKTDEYREAYEAVGF